MRILAKRGKSSNRKYRSGLHKFRNGCYLYEYSIYELYKIDSRYVWKFIRLMRYKMGFDQELFDGARINLPKNRNHQHKNGIKYLVFKEEDLQ